MFRSYQDACEYINQGRNPNDRPYGHGRATRVVRNSDGSIAVRYHDTDVVTYYPERVVVDTEGWRTATTKARINECIRVISDWQIRQLGGIWYWERGATQIPYNDPSEFDYTGALVSVTTINLHELQTLIRQIRVYQKHVRTMIERGELDEPGPGDCWYCNFRTEEGVPLGEALRDPSHLIDHVNEGYVVPSLIWHAVARYGSRMELWALQTSADGDPVDSWLADGISQRVVSYLKDQIGIAR